MNESHRECATIKEDLARHERGEPPISPEARQATALKHWEALKPQRLHYQLVFADGAVSDNALDATPRFSVRRITTAMTVIPSSMLKK